MPFFGMKSRCSLFRWILLIAFLAAARSSNAAFDAFIRFEGPSNGARNVPGDSVDKQFTGGDGWMEISSFDQGIEHLFSFGPRGGASAGKAAFRDFSFGKKLNTASPILFEATGIGGFYETAELVLRRSGVAVAPQPFYSALFRDTVITGVDWEGSSGDDTPVENVRTAFGGLQFSFTSFDSRGKPVTTVTVNWDAISNTGGDGPFSDTVLPPVLTYASGHSVVSGGSLQISPTAGPSSSDGISSVSVKSAGGYTGGISVNSSGVVQITGAQPVGGPYHIVIQAVNAHDLSTDAGFDLTVSAVIPALIANSDTTTRGLGTSVKIQISSLIANDSAGAIFDSLPSAATALGGHVSVSGAQIIYEPPFPDPGTSDSFSYRIRDNNGQFANGAIAVNVGGPDGGPSGNLHIRVTESGTVLQLAGIPGRRYQLQKALLIQGPWSDFGSVVTADENGFAEWSDPDQTPVRFYRAFNSIP